MKVTDKDPNTEKKPATYEDPWVHTAKENPNGLGHCEFAEAEYLRDLRRPF